MEQISKPLLQKFSKREQVRQHRQNPKKISQKENRRDTTRGKSKSEKKKLSCQKDDAEKNGQKIWEKDHNFNV